MLVLFGLSIFWVCFIEVILLSALVINEQEIAGAASLFVFGIAAHYISGVNVIGFAREHALYIAELSLVYLVAGVAWGFAKWFFFVQEKREQYVEMKAAHTKNCAALHVELRDVTKKVQGMEATPSGRPLTLRDITNAQLSLDRTESQFKSDLELKIGTLPPSAKKHKGRIISWISYWPISLVWTLLKDFVKKIFKQIFELFSGLFQRISNHMFKDIKLEDVSHE